MDAASRSGFGSDPVVGSVPGHSAEEISLANGMASGKVVELANMASDELSERVCTAGLNSTETGGRIDRPIIDLTRGASPDSLSEKINTRFFSVSADSIDDETPSFAVTSTQDNLGLSMDNTEQVVEEDAAIDLLNEGTENGPGPTRAAVAQGAPPQPADVAAQDTQVAADAPNVQPAPADAPPGAPQLAELKLIQKAHDLIANLGAQYQPRVLADIMDLFPGRQITVDFDLKLSQKTGEPVVKTELRGSKFCCSVKTTYTIKVEGLAEPIEFARFIPTSSTNPEVAATAVLAAGKIVADVLSNREQPGNEGRVNQLLTGNRGFTIGMAYDAAGRAKTVKTVKVGGTPMQTPDNFRLESNIPSRGTYRSRFGADTTHIPVSNPILGSNVKIKYPKVEALTGQFSTTNLEKYIKALKEDGKKKIEEGKKFTQPFATIEPGSWLKFKGAETKETAELRDLINDLRRNDRASVDSNGNPLPASTKVGQYRQLQLELAAAARDSTVAEDVLSGLHTKMENLEKEINQTNQGLLDKLGRLEDLRTEISAMENHIGDLLANGKKLDKTQKKDLTDLRAALQAEFAEVDKVFTFVDSEMSAANITRSKVAPPAQPPAPAESVTVYM